MAHRILMRVVLTGAKVFGKAFKEAYRQAAAATTAQQAAGATKSSSTRARDAEITLDESCKILDIDKHDMSLSNAQKKFDYLFDVNSKEKGGSFYVQSKVFRAMERIKQELEETNKSDKIKGDSKDKDTNEGKSVNDTKKSG